MSCSHEVFQLRKEHKLDEALAKVRECYAANADDLWLQRAYGWVLYDLVKQEAEAFAANDVAPSHLANRFNALLGEYRQFGENVRPDLLHSMLLTQVLKGSRIWHGFLEFARWWGPEYFRDEDKQPYTPPEGREIPSLAIRYGYAVGREASHRAAEIDAELLAWAEAQVDAALSELPNDQWLHYYKSQFLLSRGETEEARECLMPVLRRQQRAAWVWSLFGHVHEQNDLGMAITCYFRAVQLARQPQEVANTRISLARLLAAKERFEEAAVQVRLALEYRTVGNFRIPRELAQLIGTDWYRNLANRTDLTPEPDVANEADAILFGAERGQVNYRLGVVDNQNPDKALAHVAFTPDEGSVLLYRRFRGIDRVAVGDIVEVGFASEGHHPVRWRNSEAMYIDGFVSEMTGELTRRDGQAYGFMNTDDGQRVFVHPALLDRRPENHAQEQTCIAVVGKDKKGEQGWRALRWVLQAT